MWSGLSRKDKEREGQGQGRVRDGRGKKYSGATAQWLLPAETQMWICKPTASNQGKGIFLIRNQEEAAALQAKTQSIEDDPIYRKMPFRAPQARVVQRCGSGCQEGLESQAGITQTGCCL